MRLLLSLLIALLLIGCDNPDHIPDKSMDGKTVTDYSGNQYRARYYVTIGGKSVYFLDKIEDAKQAVAGEREE